MNWPEFHHEAMATTFGIIIADQSQAYAGQAAAAAWRELDRLENELSRFIESSDIARANRLACGETTVIGDDALECLLLAAEVCVATQRAFDPAYASVPANDAVADTPAYTLDPAAHTITSHAATLQLDLGAIGKGYALDRLAALFRDWDISSACLQSGGSTALVLAPPAGENGWPIGIGEGVTQRILPLAHVALSGSGIAVKGEHLIDPRARLPATRVRRTWALAAGAALSDALSTAFFVMSNAEVAMFCAQFPEVGAGLITADGELLTHGTLAQLTSV